MSSRVFDKATTYRIGELRPGSPVDTNEPTWKNTKVISMTGDQLVKAGAKDATQLFTDNPLSLPAGRTWHIYSVDENGEAQYFTEGYVIKDGLADGDEPPGLFQPQTYSPIRTKNLLDMQEAVSGPFERIVAQQSQTMDRMIDRLEAMEQREQQLFDYIRKMERDQYEMQQQYKQEKAIREVEDRFQDQINSLQDKYNKRLEKESSGLADVLPLKDMLQELTPMLAQWMVSKFMAGNGGGLPPGMADHVPAEPHHERPTEEEMGVRELVPTQVPSRNGR